MAVTRTRAERIEKVIVCVIPQYDYNAYPRNAPRNAHTHTTNSTHSSLSSRASHPVSVADPETERDGSSTQGRIDTQHGSRLRSDTHSWVPTSQSVSFSIEHSNVSVGRHTRDGKQKRTFCGCVYTGHRCPIVLGSMPYKIPPATWCVRTSVDVRTWTLRGSTTSRNPSLSW